MRIGEAAKRLGVTAQTIRNYIREGKLECYWTPTGQRIITEEQLNKALVGTPAEIEDTRQPAYYARSSRGSNKEIQSQLNKLEQTYGTEHLTYTDKGSGLNENRKGLQKLINDAQHYKISTIYITDKDRLTRFGYKYLEILFQQLNVNIIILDNKENNETIYDELMRDFMALIASFSGKFYRIRGYEQQKQLLQTATKQIEQKQAETKQNETH